MSKKFKIPTNHKKPHLNLFSLDGEEGKTAAYNSGSGVRSHIELFSNREIIIEGCRGVDEYREDYIKLKLIKGSITLCGSEFCIKSFENSSIVVNGNISSLEFCV